MAAALVAVCDGRPAPLARVTGLLARIAAGFARRMPRLGTASPRRFVGRLDAIASRARSTVVVHRATDPCPVTRGEVLLVTHDLSQSGAPKVVVVLAGILAEAGWGATIVSPTDGPLRATLVDAGFAVVIDADGLTNRSRTLGVLAGAADVAFCNTVVTRGAVRALHARLRVVWYLHEVSLIEELAAADPDFPADFALPHALWCGSEHSAVLVRRWRPDVRVVPYGLDALQPTSTATADPRRLVRITIFGSLELRKGQDLAIEAVRSLPPAERAAIELVFHGRVLSPDFRAGLEQAIGDAPVRIGAELDAAGYRDAMFATDIVLVASRDDTLPLVSLDALGARRILAVTPTTGTAAYLADGVDGFVAGAPTAPAIAAMLSAVLARRADWPAIADRGAAVFAARFSKATFARVVTEAVAG